MELFHVGKFGIFGSKDPTLFDGLGPCFGLVQITGSILLRYVLKFLIERYVDVIIHLFCALFDIQNLKIHLFEIQNPIFVTQD